MQIGVPEASRGQVGELAFDRQRDNVPVVKAESRIDAVWLFWHWEKEGVPD